MLVQLLREEKRCVTAAGNNSPGHSREAHDAKIQNVRNGNFSLISTAQFKPVGYLHLPQMNTAYVFLTSEETTRAFFTFA